jgi:hypothetical protein
MFEQVSALTDVERRNSAMKRFLLTLLIALGVSAPAQATVHNVAPPGNSGVNQYIESIPTDHGNQPTNSVHSKSGSSHSGGAVGGGGSSGGGGGAGGSAGSGAASGSSGPSAPVPASTQRALSSRGADGRAAAALASGTAPRVVPRGHTHGQSAASPAPIPTPAKASVGGSSALGSLASALTGSASSGGLGTLLPVILVVALLGSAGMAIRRRRSES